VQWPDAYRGNNVTPPPTTDLSVRILIVMLTPAPIQELADTLQRSRNSPPTVRPLCRRREQHPPGTRFSAERSGDAGEQTAPRWIKSRVFRMLHHVGGLVSWPLLLLFPLTGVVLLHAMDVPALLTHGLPAHWFPSQFDHNRWQGPIQPHLRTLAVSPTDMARLWAGYTYGLFASAGGKRPPGAPTGGNFPGAMCGTPRMLTVSNRCLGSPSWANGSG
jgi:hypothetical protein